jgi:hypothetical protein
MPIYTFTAHIEDGKIFESNNFESLVDKTSKYLKFLPENTIVKIYDNKLSKRTNSLFVIGRYTYCEYRKLIPYYGDKF